MLDKNQLFLFSMYAEQSDFALIPKHLIPTSQLTFEQKLVLGVLFNRAGESQPKFPTYEEFTSLLNLSRKEVFIALKSLQKMQILENESANFSRKSSQKNHEFIIFSKKNFQKSTQVTSVASYVNTILNLSNLNSRIKIERSEINIHTRKKKLAARIQTSAKKQKELPESKLIKYWNSLHNTREHHDKTSKVYCNIMKYFRAMKNGTFDTLCKLDDSSFITSNKKWTDKEIMKAMHNVALLFTEGYWPPDKSKMPKSLDLLLYNSYSRKSLFHQFAQIPPTKLTSELIRNYTEFDDLFDDLSFTKTKKLNGGTDTINEFYQAIPKDKTGQIDYWFSTFKKLCDAYASWLLDQDWIEEIHVGAINTSSKLWGKFINAQENELGIRLQ